MRFEDVARALDGLDTAEVRYWVAGGWRPSTGPTSSILRGAFSAGVLRGRRIPCLSRERQRVLHQGYALRRKDRHDMQQLEQLDRLT